MDYAPYNYQVTQADVKAVKSAIKEINLPKPKLEIASLEQ